MMGPLRMTSVGLLLASALVLVVLAGDRPNLEAAVEFEWNTLDYRYVSNSRKNLYLQDPKFFIPENAMISSLAVYKSTVYVTIPRVKSAEGVPWVLGTVSHYNYGSYHHGAYHSLVRPFPDYDLHSVGNCNELQNPLAMEVDPNTGHLYVVDTGRAGLLTDQANLTSVTSCPAKIVVYDLAHSRVLSQHVLPDSVVSRNTSILHSLVLDYKYPHGDSVRYAYIADSGENQLVVHDFLTNQTWSFFDKSMLDHASDNVHINGQDYGVATGLSGLALSPDFNYIYWSGMGSDTIYQMPTWPLRTSANISTEGLVRLVGHKASSSDDMVHGKDSLYYGALSRDAVYRWEKRHDMMTQHVPEDQVTMTTQTQLVQNWETVQWPDSLCLDERGALWFTTSRAHLFLTGQLNVNETNFRIFKLNVGDYSYLQDSTPSNLPVVG